MANPSAATYATLADARREAFVANADATSGDADLLTALRFVTARIDEELPGQRFLPTVETRYYDAQSRRFGGAIEGAELFLDMDLISLTSLTNGDGTVITSDNYLLLPRSGAPYSSIKLTPTGGIAWQIDSTGEYRGQIEVAGIWASGNPRTGNWLTGVDTLGAAITTTTETVITLTWSANTDPLLREPRFSAGQIVRFSGGELAEILSDSFQNKTITVRRGARGSTPTTHANGATVDVWDVDANIRMAAARWAGYCYKRRGVFADSTFDAVNAVSTRFPKDVPHDVAGILALFRPRKSSVRMVAV